MLVLVIVLQHMVPVIELEVITMTIQLEKYEHLYVNTNDIINIVDQLEL
jgi:uncharacterized protein YlbG (UPF0298 family)